MGYSSSESVLFLNWFNQAVVAMAAVLSVAVLEALIDILTFHSYPSTVRMLLLRKVFFLGGAFIINCYILTIHKGDTTVLDVSRLQSFQSFCLIHGCLSIISAHHDCTKLRYANMVIQVFVIISDAVLARSYFVVNLNSINGFIAIVFFTGSVLVYVYFFIHSISLNEWHILSNCNNSFRGERFLVFLCICILWIAFICKIIFMCSCFGNGLGEITQAILLGYQYSFSILSVLLSMAHTRISIWRGHCLQVSELILSGSSLSFFVLTSTNIQDEILMLKCNIIRYISHELRSPLNTISVGLQQYSEHDRDIAANLESRNNSKLCGKNRNTDSSMVVDVNRILLDMVIACDHSVCILNNLASYELLERGVVLTLGEVRVYDCVQELIRSNQNKTNARRKILILHETAEDLQDICIRADAYCLQHVLQNILDIVLNLTTTNTTTQVILSQVGDNNFSGRGQPQASPIIQGTESFKTIQTIPALQTRFPVLGRLSNRSRTLPDMERLRINVSMLDYIPPEVNAHAEGKLPNPHLTSLLIVDVDN